MFGISLWKVADEENRELIFSMTDSGNKLLDLGCGDGTFTVEVAKKANAEPYGVDFSKNLVLKAREKGVNAICSDLNKPLPFKDNIFDIIIANQIIEHLMNTDLFIREIYRVLKSGGIAIISTPNLSGWHNIFSLILGKQPFPYHISNEVILGNSFDPKRGLKHKNPGEIHYRIFTYEGLKDLLEYHGFLVEEVRGAEFYPFPKKVSRILARLDKRHAVYLTVKVRK